jgi:hypothetical protein
MIKALDEYPLSGTIHTALIALAKFADDEGGNCYPSIGTLQRMLKVDRRATRRLLNKLEEQGVISVVANRFGGDQGQTKRYQINVSKIATPKLTGGLHTPGVAKAYTGGLEDTYRGSVHPPIDLKDKKDITTTAKPKPARKKTVVTSEHFQKWWDAYPQSVRKVAMGKCLEIWKKKRYDGESDQIMAFLEAMMDEYTKENLRWCPMTTSFLKARKWDGFEPTTKYDPFDGAI